jgi:hypothetical protein
MERKNLLFIKDNCDLSNKLLSLIGETFRVLNTDSIKVPNELKDYEVPFIIVKNIIKPMEREYAITYLENIKFFNQSTNNISNKIIQMKPIINDLDKIGVNKEFNKISDEYTFIEDGKNIENICRTLDSIDDTNKIDIITDFNGDKKLDEKTTANELKDMILNRNRQLRMHLSGRR